MTTLETVLAKCQGVTIEERNAAQAEVARLRGLLDAARSALQRIADYGLSDESVALERDEFSTPEDQTIHAWVRSARAALSQMGGA